MFLGWRHVRRRKRVVGLLVAAITLSLFLPVAISIVVKEAEQHLRSRSVATPLLLGSPGSPLELVFNGVYFTEPGVDTIPVGRARALSADGYASVIPVYARYRARGFPIVGTSIDYFDYRGLHAADGRMFSRLGDCVLGARVARELGIGPGGSLISTPDQVFDLAGVYPLKMRVTGVLAPTGTADDRAVFADVATTWIIEGIAHGHDAAAETDGDETVLRKGEDGNLALNASVREFTEVTADNIDSFHFHGDPETFPITAAIVRPRDQKAETILLGRYVGGRNDLQLVRPDDVMQSLFATVFQVRSLVIAALVAVGLTAVAITVLVFVLSNRLRAREFTSLAHIGADLGSVRALVAFEALFVGATSLLLTAVLILPLELVVPSLLELFVG